jgi:Kef-type K+ transport system membrane component KefB
MVDLLPNLIPPSNLSGPVLISYLLFDIFLIGLMARTVGNALVRIGQPRVVGEMLAGILLGPTLLGQNLSEVVTPLSVRPILNGIATLALIMFMFLAGIEYDMSKVKGRGMQAGLLALLSVAFPAVLGFPLANAMYNSTFAGPASQTSFPFALFLGAALSVTAFPVMAYILIERGELNSPMGALGIASAGLISVLMFTYIAFASAVASAGGFSDLIINILLVIVFGAFSWFIVRPLLARFFHPAIQQELIPGNVLALISSGMVLFGLIAHVIGMNALVGGFVWGMILPVDIKFRKAVAAKIQDIAMVFFLPIFFAMAGFSTDLKLISVAHLPIVFLVLIAAIAGKYLAAIPARVLGLSWSEAGILGTLFNSRGLLVLVVGLIGLELEIITNLTFTIIVIVALITNLMTLPLLNLITSLQSRSTGVIEESISRVN